ncbi:maleylpyruvate isomerase N-terminal domain-containing protein [Nakamurella leprariae]|uniref:Maleylpyruvate isomerase N-terminal domain-containing protein n=1 Tax=Nakamurella leprariae TaxID=2803911 RepID=A0A938YB33_9ACTN|nr:maleylpyruvate isomerase N-terminal domain-containing protein [Nakamurella leprariae]MBM9466326.1 maleylpyruvate isomerase N-terminal domain-containing protein [Nakamurella leprariae]
MDGTNLRQSARSSAAFLRSVADQDWSVTVPSLGWTGSRTVAHMCETLLWYPTDLANGPQPLDTMQLSVPDGPDGNSREALVTTLVTFADVLAHVVDGVPAGWRGHHSWGLADASGFAAMGCDELLVHTWDVGQGLGARFDPPPVLAGMVARRLFPWAPVDRDPWQTLLWANGRVDLAGLPRQVDWQWHCAPLSEWTGRASGLT